MQEVTPDQLLARLRVENPWWSPPHGIPSDWARLEPRLFLEAFWPLFRSTSPHRALVLLGPRRVGKTVLLHHVVARAIREGTPAESIAYLSLDTPLYTDRSLEELFRLALQASGRTDPRGATMIFDEIQYLRDWEQHLKSLVDTHRSTRFVASGSAAAALKLKSDESGAGRFTDVLMPPLTFIEFLMMLDRENLAVACLNPTPGSAVPIDELNESFVEYINSGGYPEAVLTDGVKRDPVRFIRQDVIDKVLLRDLPSLYGIQDIQELNRLFNLLAWNTGQEVSIEGLSKRSGVSKNTIKRYIEYLKAAFLIEVVHRVDDNAKRFQRAVHFKVYLTNTSMRAALYFPETMDGECMGHLVETALLAQEPMPSRAEIHYARWEKGKGEVDFVRLDRAGRVGGVVEVKWSDLPVSDFSEIKSLIAFCRREGNPRTAVVTTRSVWAQRVIEGVKVRFMPSSVMALIKGIELVKHEELLALHAGSDAGILATEHIPS